MADWVAYRITKDTIGPTRDRIWRADPALAPEETLEPEDYTGANAALATDRGHQVPLASFTGTPEWEATNFLSNITPQKSELNQGPWERLETAERTLARRQDVPAVYVLTGPLYQSAMPALPQADEPHRVPSGFWKVIAIQSGDGLKIAAFIMGQETPRDSWYCTHATTVAAVEVSSGLRLFTDLSSATHDLLAQVDAPLKLDLGCNGGKND